MFGSVKADNGYFNKERIFIKSKLAPGVPSAFGRREPSFRSVSTLDNTGTFSSLSNNWG